MFHRVVMRIICITFVKVIASKISYQWFLKYDLHTSNTGINQEHVREANCQNLPQIYRNSGWSSNLFYSVLGILMLASVYKHYFTLLQGTG